MNFRKASSVSLLLLLASGIYAATIKCNVYTSPGPGCLIGVYSQSLRNTHAFLCSQIQNFYYYRCFIDAENGVEIPINFTTSCAGNDVVMYLYYPIESHVSLLAGPPYAICLDDKFSKVLDVYNTYLHANIPSGAVSILGLYSYINSHVQGKNGNYKIYLYIVDKKPPTVTTSINNNSYVLLPTVYNITCSDDNYVYKCRYTILESGNTREKICYSKSCEIKVPLTNHLCPKPVCTVKITAIDLAGNVKTVTYTYKILNTKLQIIADPEIGSTTLYDLFSKTTYKIAVKNAGSTKLNNVCISRTGCDQVLSVSNGVQDLYVPICLGSLDPGEQRRITVYIQPYKVGRCKLKITANATDSVTHKPIETSITTYVEVSEEVGPLHIRVVDEKLSVAIILIVVGTFLVI